MASSNTRKHATHSGTVPARLSKEEWLARALEVLGKKGAGELTIESLARHLGVTKGSFYWHFRDRADFFRQLIEYWGQTIHPDGDRQNFNPGQPSRRAAAGINAVGAQQTPGSLRNAGTRLGPTEPGARTAGAQRGQASHRFCQVAVYGNGVR